MIFLYLFLVTLLPKTESVKCVYSVISLSSSTTIPKNCTRLEARFRIDQSSDLSDSQLTELFSKVRDIEGVVQIWNSQLTSANFLGNIRMITGDRLDNALSIVNNTLLSSLNITSLVFSDGKVEIKNNPSLDLKSNCPFIHKAFFNRRTISSNLFDCGCEISTPLKWPLIRDFPEDCIVLYGNLIMNSPAPPPEVLYRLLSVTTLYGYIDFRYTNLETLGFLQNLEEIEAGPNDNYIIYLQSNRYLSRLDFVHLRSVKSQNPKARIEIHDGTCLDPAFVQLLAYSDANHYLYSTTFCPLNRINNPSFYCTGPITSISDRCTRYLGDLVYWNPESFFYMSMSWNYTKVPEKEWKKVQQLEYIFGSLAVQGSAMTEISLPNLREIYQLTTVVTNTHNFNNPIYIGYNYNLTKVSFPSLQYSYGIIRFEENTNLVTDDDFCREMTDNKTLVCVGTSGEWNCRDYLPESTRESILG